MFLCYVLTPQPLPAQAVLSGGCQTRTRTPSTRHWVRGKFPKRNLTAVHNASPRDPDSCELQTARSPPLLIPGTCQLQHCVSCCRCRRRYCVPRSVLHRRRCAPLTEPKRVCHRVAPSPDVETHRQNQTTTTGTFKSIVDVRTHRGHLVRSVSS